MRAGTIAITSLAFAVANMGAVHSRAETSVRDRFTVAPGQGRFPAAGVIRVDGVTYRLADLQAPAPGDRSRRSGRSYPVGFDAQQNWEAFARSRTLVCDVLTRAGAPTVRCRAQASDGSRDAGEWLLSQGFAYAGVAAPPSYLAAEQDARSRRAGLHSVQP